MIFLLYRVLQLLLSPVVSAYLLWRILRDRRYLFSMKERLGRLPPSWKQTAAGAIWLHAVSVGEVIAAIPLLQQIAAERPQVTVFVSTSTLAGRITAGTRLPGLVAGVFFCPLDIVWCVRRVLRHLRPSLLIVMETEIWPNLFREVTRLGAGLVIVNGRISDRAFPRYRRFSAFFRPVLQLCDRILVQSEEMRARFTAAGARPESIEVAGNLKYDFTPADSKLSKIAEALPFIQARNGPGNDSRIWIAASTSADQEGNEEEAVIAAQRKLRGWRLILAPRKPERFADVAMLLANSGLRWTRRSGLDDPGADVLLLDSIGELSGLFGFADAVFMGGTLVRRGGHNILEPAAFGRGIVIGPDMDNFRDIAEDFLAKEAALRIESGAQLADAILRVGSEPGFGERARAAAESRRGATERTARSTFAIYDSRFPWSRAPQPAYLAGQVLAQIWRIGSAYDRARKIRHRRRLAVPVISVGNITAGGTGKTPVTIQILEGLSAAGLRPGLLMRGHGRDESKPVIVPDSRTRLEITHTGDEAQLYHRVVNVPIGIYADRYSVGKEMVTAKMARILVMDDGFQHLQLARDFDLVLIDALDPFGGGHLLPLGRLREPMEGLSRASAFLITRSDEVACTAAIQTVLRRYNPNAPVFRSRTVPREWLTFGDQEVPVEEIANRRALAFCGLGNPNSFWRTLKQLGIAPIEQLGFGDHHRYTPVELRRLFRYAEDIKAEVLLTTAKDAVNLCEGCPDLVSPLRLYWLEIGVEIENGGELMERLESLVA